MRRISIRALMAFVLLSAVGLAALRNASELWAGIMLLLALAAAGVAIVGAALMQGRERAWWLGFAVFGGGYLVVALCPVRSELPTTLEFSYVHSRVTAQSSAQSSYDATASALLSRRESLLALQKILDTSQAASFISDSSSPAIARLENQVKALESRLNADTASLDSMTRMLDAEERRINRWASVFPGAANLDAFQRVGHSLCALLAGLVGVTVALWFWERKRRPEVGAAG